jgi:transposase InsO family protein
LAYSWPQPSFFGKSNKAQTNSWKNSMQYMYKVLNDEDIPDNSGVAIEFNIPSTSKRIDFILSGYDSRKQDSVIIIELKQWEEFYNVHRPHGSLKGRTPYEVLKTHLDL